MARMQQDNATGRWIGLVIFVSAVFYWGNVHLALERLDPALKPLYWYVATIGIAGVVALLARRAMPHGSALVVALGFCGLLCYDAFIAIPYLGEAHTRQALVDITEAVGVMIAFIVFLHNERHVTRARAALLLVVAVGVPMNIWDFATWSWTTTAGRAAGLYLNSNLSGYMLVIGMVGASTLIPRRFRLLFCLYAGIGVFLTISRSSWLLWAIAVIAMEATGCFNPRKSYATVLLVAAVSLGVVYGLLTGGALEYLNLSGLGKLTPDVINRLGGGGGDAFQDLSALSRQHAAWQAIETFVQHPVFGAGFGVAREWPVQPHNLYLLIAAQGGVIGLGIFVAMLMYLWRKTTGNGRLLLAMYVLLSLFYHNGLDQPPMLALLALVASLREPAREETTEEAMVASAVRAPG